MRILCAKKTSVPQKWFGLISGITLLVAGCQTSSVDDLGVTAPQPTQTTQIVPAPTAQPTPLKTALVAKAPTIAGQQALDRARKTGIYPKFGHVQVGETSQLTSAKKNALRRDLRNARRVATERSLGENFTKYQIELQNLRHKARNHSKKSRSNDDNLTDAQKELRKLRRKARNHGKDAVTKIGKPTS